MKKKSYSETRSELHDKALKNLLSGQPFVIATIELGEKGKRAATYWDLGPDATFRDVENLIATMENTLFRLRMMMFQENKREEYNND